MKVLLVSPQMDNPNGGIAIWTDIYLASCKDAGIECSLVNTQPIGARAKNGGAKRNFFDEIVRTKSIFDQLNTALKDCEHEVIHINTSCGTFGMIRDYLIAKRAKKLNPNSKIIVHFHCDIPVQVRGAISKLFLSKLLKVSDVNLVLCENSAQFLSKEFNCDSIKVPNFIDEDVIIKSKKQIGDHIEKAFFVGRVIKEKGAFELFELAKRFPEIEFCLVGAVGKEIEVPASLPNLNMPGPMSHDNVIKEMDESDIFIFPTHSEGFSIALMEAMARGLPTVTTDVGANKDMIESGGGVITPVEDIEALSLGIKALSSKEVRASMSAWNVEKVKRNYTTAAVIKKIIHCYEA